MQICFVNSFFPPWRGGAETYTYNLARKLAARGHSVTVACAAPPFKPGRYIVDLICVNRLPVAGWVYGTPIIPSLAPNLMDVNADLLHAGFPSPYNAFLVSFVSRLRGIPSVLTWHNDLPAVTSTAGLLVGLHDSLVLPTYLGQYGRIIATTEIYARQSPILARWRRKVQVVPNGVDCSRFNPQVDEGLVRARLNLRNRPMILFIGTLTKWHRYKGLDILLEAFSLLVKTVPDAALVVVGEGEVRREYENMSINLGIRRDVFFVGDVDNSDLPRFCSASDFLVLPSKDRSEGFGLTILEANACGKPAIGSNVGGIPSVISDGCNGLLVPPCDPPKLSEAMRYLVENVEERLRMGRNGKRFAEQRDWSFIAAKMEGIYEKVLSG
jgi:glycosyltransferase involved in cell wall biosynthesis